MSLEHNIANDLVTLLNGVTFNPEIVFQRQHIVRVTLSDLCPTLGAVAPVATAQTRHSRADWLNAYQIATVIAAKAGTDFDASMDLLQTAAELAMETIKHGGRMAGAALRTIERDPYVDFERLDEDRTLQTIITSTYAREV